jgi:multidrug resistance protein MdtO
VLIVLFMTLQIPFLAVALIVVFYVSQPNVLMIKLVSVVFFLTVSVALGCVLLIIKWTYDYPLIRLVASVALFFGAIYLMRVLGKLGLAFFVVALVVIYAQTFPSMTSQSEILVRLLLWLWVVINLAIVVTLLVNAGFQQAFPGYQFKARMVFLLRGWRRFSPGRTPVLRRRSKKLPNSSPSFSLCISRRPAPARDSR